MADEATMGGPDTPALPFSRAIAWGLCLAGTLLHKL